MEINSTRTDNIMEGIMILQVGPLLVTGNIFRLKSIALYKHFTSSPFSIIHLEFGLFSININTPKQVHLLIVLHCYSNFHIKFELYIDGLY